jgi:preprotein translocase subunit SecB
MRQPPLQLDRLFFAEVTVKSGSTFSSEPTDAEVKTSVSLSENKENERAWQARLEIEVTPKGERQIPYEIRVVAFGQFSVTDEKLDRPHAAQLVAITGASIIYSAAREYLMILTGRGPWGPFQLPTVSFTDVEVGLEGQETSGGALEQARPKSRRRAPGRQAKK